MNKKQQKLIDRLNSEFDNSYMGINLNDDGKVESVYVECNLTLIELKTLVDYLEAINDAS